MVLKFQVKDHNVEFIFNKFWGTIRINVDGNLASRGFMIFGSSHNYYCMVGEHEVTVRIVQPFFFAAFRKRTYKVYVDGEEYKTFDSKGRLTLGA